MKSILVIILTALIFLGCTESEPDPEGFTVTGKRVEFSSKEMYERNLAKGKLKFLAIEIMGESEIFFPGLTEDQVKKYIEDPGVEYYTQTVMDLAELTDENRTEEDRKKFLKSVEDTYKEYNQLVMKHILAQPVAGGDAVR